APNSAQSRYPKVGGGLVVPQHEVTHRPAGVLVALDGDCYSLGGSLAAEHRGLCCHGTGARAEERITHAAGIGRVAVVEAALLVQHDGGEVVAVGDLGAFSVLVLVPSQELEDG